MIRKICMILSLATDFLIKHVLRSIILVGIMTFCIVTMISGVYLNVSKNRYKSRIKALVDVPIENLSIVTIHGSSFESTYRLLSEKEDFLAAGEVNDSEGYEINDWIGLSEALHNNYNGNIKQVQCNFDIFEVCKPELFDGKYYDAREAEKLFGEYKIGIYIGADYRGAVPVGTTFKYRWNNQVEIVVLGHLQKGEKLISDVIMDQANSDQNKTDIELDDKIIFVRIAEPSINHYYLASKISADDFRASVRKELNSDVNIVTMEEVLRYRERKNGDMYNLYNRLFVLIISVAVCMIFSFQIIAINENNKTYGILLTNGFKQKDIATIVIIENILKYLLAFSIALFISYYRHYTAYKDNLVGVDLKAFNMDFIMHTIPLCFTIGLAVVFLAIIIPVLRLSRRSVGEYLRDK
ncbi:FtsX-like permease family protein [Eubacterium ruminantium]|nr:FtsX-like permease family protein [Eubacterium ruminantium]